jgi:D-alanyl-D-alanine carboxypeptidase
VFLSRKSVFVFLFLIASLVVQSDASANPRYAALVVDVDSGRIVHEENANSLRYPASLTKLMTLYLTFQAIESGKLSMWKKLKVSSRAAGQPPSRLGLRRGQSITVRDAILAMVVKSANDVAVVLAEAIAGSEWQFAIMMNRTAKHLGMTRTNFRNASGLHHRKQRSTAKDLARLGIALRRDFPRYYKFFNYTKFRYKGRTYVTHNRVVRTYRGADGLKTGYIGASGFNLMTSAARNNKRVVAVVLGGRSSKRRDRHMVKLLDRSFYQLAKGYRGKRVMQVARKAPPAILKPGGVTLASLKPMVVDNSIQKVVEKKVQPRPSVAKVVEEKSVIVTAVKQEELVAKKPVVVAEVKKEEPKKKAEDPFQQVALEVQRAVGIQRIVTGLSDLKPLRGEGGVPIPYLRPENRLTEVFFGNDAEEKKSSRYIEYVDERAPSNPQPYIADL